MYDGVKSLYKDIRSSVLSQKYKIPTQTPSEKKNKLYMYVKVRRQGAFLKESLKLKSS